MDKKIIHDDQSLDQTKPKKNKKAGFFLITATIASLMTNTLMYSPGYSKDNNLNPSLTKKPTTESIEQKDNNKYYNIEYAEHEKLLNGTITAINAFRKKNDLKELEYDPKLQKIAQDYANYCAKNNWKGNHYDKEGNGLEERVHNNKYYGIARENLFFGSLGNDAEVVVQLRNDSPAHHQNILSPKSNYITV